MAAPRSTATKKAAAKARTKTAEPESGAAILDRVKPRRRIESTQVCLRADLIAEFQQAEEELVRLKASTAGKGGRLAGGAEVDTDEVKAQARKVRRIEDELVASQVVFTFRSLNKDEFRALTDNYPPRRGNQVDQVIGYDRDAVLNRMVRECLLTPEFEDCSGETPEGDVCVHEDCGTWDQLVAVINPSEWSELRDTANLANSGVVEAPKSVLASQILDRRASGSK